MISVEINDAQIRTAFAALTLALTDLRQPMDEIGQQMVLSTKRRMTAGLSPDGTPFAPRSPVTLGRYAKEKKKVGPHPLWQTRTMQKNIFHDPGSDQVSWGSNAIQSAVMHFGAAKGSLGPRSPWGDIPARPFLGLSEQDRTDIIEILAEWIQRATAP